MLYPCELSVPYGVNYLGTNILLCSLFVQAIGWQVIAAKIGIQRCAASSQWLNERVALSRYAHVKVILVFEYIICFSCFTKNSFK